MAWEGVLRVRDKVKRHFCRLVWAHTQFALYYIFCILNSTHSRFTKIAQRMCKRAAAFNYILMRHQHGVTPNFNGWANHKIPFLFLRPLCWILTTCSSIPLIISNQHRRFMLFERWGNQNMFSFIFCQTNCSFSSLFWHKHLLTLLKSVVLN